MILQYAVTSSQSFSSHTDSQNWTICKGSLVMLRSLVRKSDLLTWQSSGRKDTPVTRSDDDLLCEYNSGFEESTIDETKDVELERTVSADQHDHQTVMRRGEKRWMVQIMLNGSSWGLFARSIMCLISREGTQSLLLDRPLAPLSLRRCAVARLGAAPVCQSLHKQKPGFPLWNQPTSV